MKSNCKVNIEEIDFSILPLDNTFPLLLLWNSNLKHIRYHQTSLNRIFQNTYEDSTMHLQSWFNLSNNEWESNHIDFWGPKPNTFSTNKPYLFLVYTSPMDLMYALDLIFLITTKYNERSEVFQTVLCWRIAGKTLVSMITQLLR